MKANINTEYLGNNRYRITVSIDGRFEEDHSATQATVCNTRNRVINRWCRSSAEQVTANEIPEAYDMGDAIARAVGKSIEEAYPWGYYSQEDEP